MTGRALDLCAGVGGLALGLERAGFTNITTVENDDLACDAQVTNRPNWCVLRQDLLSLDPVVLMDDKFDVVSAGLPSPMTVGGMMVKGSRLDGWGSSADWTPQDLQQAVLRIVAALRPKAVVVENVAGLANSAAVDYRRVLLHALRDIGYECDWQILNASDFGVPQDRYRFILVALQRPFFSRFRWPQSSSATVTVGDALVDLMGEEGWPFASLWASSAKGLAPSIIAGSKIRGGADLGPKGSQTAWTRLSVDGSGIADKAPGTEVGREWNPKLTLRMIARLQGFPDTWQIFGKKTASYRLLGGACPPPLAEAIGRRIHDAVIMSGMPV